MKYRLKLNFKEMYKSGIQMEIEAVQFTRDSFFNEMPKFCGENICHDFIFENHIDGDVTCWVNTNEGDVLIKEGDYVFKTIDDEFAICQRMTFETFYEMMDDSSSIDMNDSSDENDIKEYENRIIEVLKPIVDEMKSKQFDSNKMDTIIGYSIYKLINEGNNQ